MQIYVQLTYVRGPVSIHGPFKGSKEEAIRLANQQADRTRAVTHVDVQTW